MKHIQGQIKAKERSTYMQG